MARAPWIPTACAATAIVACGLALALELSVLFGIHYADFDLASKDALGNATADYTCVGAASGARVHGEYGTNTVPALYDGFNLFGWPTQIGGSAVACYDADDTSGAAVPRRDLRRLVAASVHPLRKAAVDAGADASDELKATYLAARDAALGVGGDPAAANRVGFWQAVEALRALAPPPRTCAEVYDAAPSPAATADAVVAAALDAAAVGCANATPPAGATFASTVAADDAARLHAHCRAQNALARYQPYVEEGWIGRDTGGTLGVPAVAAARIVLPAWQPPMAAAPLDVDVTWDARARALYGLRFGWKAMVGVAALVLASFALIDAGFFVFAWLTLPQRLDAVARDAIDGPGDADLTAKPLLYVLATMQSVRVTRFFVFVVGWTLVLVLRSLYAWSPWSFGLLLPRTDCTTGVGWAVDDLSAPYEWISTLLLLWSLITLPISQSWLANRTAKNSNAPEVDSVDMPTVRAARGTRACFWGLAVVGLAFLAWEVVLAVAWGAGWSASILDPEDHAAATATANATWTTAEYGDATYASVVRAVCFGVFLGVTLALLLSRWLFSAVTPFSFFCSILWLLIATAAFVPMVIAFGVDFDFDLTPARCSALPPERIEYWLCETQSYAYLVLLLAALAVLLLLWVPWVVSSGCAALCNRRTYIRVPAAYVAKADKAGKRTAMAQSRQSGAASAQADFDGDDTISGCLDEFQRLPLLSLRPRGSGGLGGGGGAETAV